MKKCKHCQKLLPSSEFCKNSKGKDGLWSYCRSCESRRKKQQLINFKKACLQYKNQFCCNICGYNKNLAALDFHHINASEKDFTISQQKRLNLNDKIKQELDKCDVICSNCHRELHSLEEGVFQPNEMKPRSDTYCIDCNSKCNFGCQRCMKCNTKIRRKNIPSKQVLIDDIKFLKYLTTIGKKYKVTDNAVKKWLKHYNLYNFYKSNKRV